MVLFSFVDVGVFLLYFCCCNKSNCGLRSNPWFFDEYWKTGIWKVFCFRFNQNNEKIKTDTYTANDIPSKKCIFCIATASCTKYTTCKCIWASSGKTLQQFYSFIHCKQIKLHTSFNLSPQNAKKTVIPFVI